MRRTIHWPDKCREIYGLISTLETAAIQAYGFWLQTGRGCLDSVLARRSLECQDFLLLPWKRRGYWLQTTTTVLITMVAKVLALLLLWILVLHYYKSVVLLAFCTHWTLVVLYLLGASRSSWSCYFFPETSPDCRNRAFELVQSKASWADGTVKVKENYTSKQIWLGRIPRCNFSSFSQFFTYIVFTLFTIHMFTICPRDKI
jgi:hypothetical protein